jgi:hypothetical protein
MRIEQRCPEIGKLGSLSKIDDFESTEELESDIMLVE